MGKKVRVPQRDFVGGVTQCAGKRVNALWIRFFQLSLYNVGMNAKGMASIIFIGNVSVFLISIDILFSLGERMIVEGYRNGMFFDGNSGFYILRPTG